jgi:hypothetical protein
VVNERLVDVDVLDAQPAAGAVGEEAFEGVPVPVPVLRRTVKPISSAPCSKLAALPDRARP